LTEHDVFRLSDKYVVWLITAKDGNLLEIAGAEIYYSTEFPNQPKSSGTEFFPIRGEDVLSRIRSSKK
jgi:hypothetical protein